MVHRWPGHPPSARVHTVMPSWEPANRIDNCEALRNGSPRGPGSVGRRPPGDCSNGKDDEDTETDAQCGHHLRPPRGDRAAVTSGLGSSGLRLARLIAPTGTGGSTATRHSDEQGGPPSSPEVSGKRTGHRTLWAYARGFTPTGGGIR